MSEVHSGSDEGPTPSSDEAEEGHPGKIRRSVSIAGALLLVLAIILVVVNGIATAVLERRASARIGDAIGKPARVDFVGWPVIPRMLIGALPRAEISSGLGAPDDSPFRTFDATLFEVNVDLPGGIIPSRGPIRVRAGRVVVGAALRPGPPEPRLDALDVTLRDAVFVLGRTAAGTVLQARTAEMTASGLDIPESRARLQTVHLSLPQLRVERTTGTGQSGFKAESPGGALQAVLDETSANLLWRGPGQLKFEQGAVALNYGPISLVVVLAVEQGALVLQPQVPPPVAGLVGEVPALRIHPDLPPGIVLTGVEVRPGALELSGTAEKWVVPAELRPANSS